MDGKTQVVYIDNICDVPYIAIYCELLKGLLGLVMKHFLQIIAESQAKPFFSRSPPHCVPDSILSS